MASRKKNAAFITYRRNGNRIHASTMEGSPTQSENQQIHPQSLQLYPSAHPLPHFGSFTQTHITHRTNVPALQNRIQSRFVFPAPTQRPVLPNSPNNSPTWSLRNAAFDFNQPIDIGPGFSFSPVKPSSGNYSGFRTLAISTLTTPDYPKRKENSRTTYVASSAENRNIASTEEDNDVVYLFTVENGPEGQIVEEVDLSSDSQVHPIASTFKIPKEPIKIAQNTNNKRKVMDSPEAEGIKKRRSNIFQPFCSTCGSHYNTLLKNADFMCVANCGHLFCSLCCGIKSSTAAARNCTLCNKKLEGLRKIHL